MALNDQYLKQFLHAQVTETYSERDTILYALGVGVGQTDPFDSGAMQYSYEQELVALPTLACVLAAGDGDWMRKPETGITWQKVLHGEQSLRIFRPLAAQGTIVSQLMIDGVYDKGPDKGAVMVMTRRLTDAATGERIADVGSVAFMRGDGGFGGSSEGAPKPHPVPTDRPADLVLDLPTRADQAFLYRLSGDYNPLHVDPAMAAGAGFDRPILHGLCAYGVVCRAVLRMVCDNNPARLRRFDVRFSSPLYPGETIRTELWREDAGRAAFRVIAVERGIVIQNNGVVEYV